MHKKTIIQSLIKNLVPFYSFSSSWSKIETCIEAKLGR